MLTTPKAVYEHWRRTGQCAACWQDIKHEMHLYNHWKRHHDTTPAQIKLFSDNPKAERPQYWVWFQNTWTEVPMHVALAAMFHKRCVAVSKPQKGVTHA